MLKYIILIFVVFINLYSNDFIYSGKWYQLFQEKRGDTYIQEKEILNLSPNGDLKLHVFVSSQNKYSRAGFRDLEFVVDGQWKFCNKKMVFVLKDIYQNRIAGMNKINQNSLKLVINQITKKYPKCSIFMYDVNKLPRRKHRGFLSD